MKAARTEGHLSLLWRLRSVSDKRIINANHLVRKLDHRIAIVESGSILETDQVEQLCSSRERSTDEPNYMGLIHIHPLG